MCYTCNYIDYFTPLFKNPTWYFGCAFAVSRLIFYFSVGCFHVVRNTVHSFSPMFVFQSTLYCNALGIWFSFSYSYGLILSLILRIY